MVELDCEAGGLRPRIGVIGVGGSGGNAIANMIRSGVNGVGFVAANTDAQALSASPAEHIVQLGRRLTAGLGAGSRPEIGKAAAEESLAEIEAVLEGLDMCFIAAGMGGGTGSGAAPVIAKAARMRGILTVGVVTKPFAFEGARRARLAEAGLEDLREQVDTLIVVPNQNLFRVADADTTFKAAFELADDVLLQGVRGITDLMVLPGLINLDFADVRAIMTGMGRAMMGTGEASGDDRARQAAELAISNPLLDDALKGARGLIVSITGGEDLRLMEVDEAAAYIKDLVDPEADIIWGSAFNGSLEGRIRVSVVATGLNGSADAADGRVPAAVQMVAAESMERPELPSAAPSPAEPDLFQGFEPAALLTAIEAVAGPLQPIDPPAWTDDEAEPDGSAAQDELLLVTVESPPTVQSCAPLALPADHAGPEPEPRGPSLFERMAAAARGAMRAQSGTEAVSTPDERLERHAA